MDQNAAIAVVGTFDSKGEEHLFIKKAIERRGLTVLAINTRMVGGGSGRRATVRSGYA
jgi:uncharacterized protein (UPF0261 family)